MKNKIIGILARLFIIPILLIYMLVIALGSIVSIIYYVFTGDEILTYLVDKFGDMTDKLMEYTKL